MNLYTRYPELSVCKNEIEAAIDAILHTYHQGGKLLLCGNGGSSADCAHIAGELLKGFLQSRPVADIHIPEDLRGRLQGSLPAIDLTAQAAILSAYANDADPAMVYAQLVYGYGKPEDIFIGLSTSGNSQNVVNAARVAKARGLKTIAMTGANSSRLSEVCDITIRVPRQKLIRYRNCICRYIMISVPG